MTILNTDGLLAVVRFRGACDLDGILDALGRGGVRLLEVTIDTPGAIEAVERAAGAGRIIGVGTVVSADAVRRCADAGAGFVVGPGLVPEVIEAARGLGIEAIPGVFTASELLRALALGAEAVKLFPAGSFGPDHVRALRGPFPDVPIVPTGGIAVDEIAAYLDAGATCVGLGGGLVGAEAPRSDLELTAIEQRATLAREAVDRWRSRTSSSRG